jgi:hypothetical protein
LTIVLVVTKLGYGLSRHSPGERHALYFVALSLQNIDHPELPQKIVLHFTAYIFTIHRTVHLPYRATVELFVRKQRSLLFDSTS